MTFGTYSYTNDLGQDVWWITPDPSIVSPRPVAGDVRVLVIHDTDGQGDSRAWLKTNPAPVSTHYLIGMYPDCVTQGNPKGIRIYKFASEANTQTYTEGFGVLGGEPGNPNAYSVAIEIEYIGGTPWDMDLLKGAATLARSIINGWQAKGKQLLVVGHHHIDQNKVDPRLDWSGFMEMVYGAQ